MSQFYFNQEKLELCVDMLMDRWCSTEELMDALEVTNVRTVYRFIEVVHKDLGQNVARLDHSGEKLFKVISEDELTF